MNLTGQTVYQKGRKPAKVKAVRDDAHDRTCTLQIPGVCCHDPAQTVGSHMRFFGIAGGAQKPDDIYILDSCGPCHAVLDARDKWERHGLTAWDVLRAFMFTLRNRRAAGLIKLRGEE